MPAGDCGLVPRPMALFRLLLCVVGFQSGDGPRLLGLFAELHVCSSVCAPITHAVVKYTTNMSHINNT